MKKMILIFSHKLTKKQVLDARESLGVDSFIYLPTELQKKWSLIPPDVRSIQESTYKIKEWIAATANKDDYILVQGDFGATCDVVNYCKCKGLKAIYSTTKREAKEKVRSDGKADIIHVFEHIRYREY